MRRNKLQKNDECRRAPGQKLDGGGGYSSLRRGLSIVAAKQRPQFSLRHHGNFWSDLDISDSDAVSRRRHSTPASSEEYARLSRNEIDQCGKTGIRRDVAGALKEKPHYKTQLGDRSGASIIVTLDQNSGAKAVAERGKAILADLDERLPLIFGDRPAANRAEELF